MIFIDFQKAFDSLNVILQKCLESFNFGQNFNHWVLTFYENIQSCVTMVSPLNTSIERGDPLSPFLFVVAVETLAIAVRQNSRMKGITIDN